MGGRQDMQAAPGTNAFFAGNCRFLTRKLWGVASEPPYFHHGKFTTLREAVLGHGGEGSPSRDAFRGLDKSERDAVIEFLKSLQVLPPGTRARVVDENGRPRHRQAPRAILQRGRRASIVDRRPAGEVRLPDHL